MSLPSSSDAQKQIIQLQMRIMELQNQQRRIYQQQLEAEQMLHHLVQFPMMPESSLQQVMYPTSRSDPEFHLALATSLQNMLQNSVPSAMPNPSQSHSSSDQSSYGKSNSVSPPQLLLPQSYLPSQQMFAPPNTRPIKTKRESDNDLIDEEDYDEGDIFDDSLLQSGSTQPRSSKRWTASEYKTLLDGVRAGGDLAELSTKLGMPLTTARKILNRHRQDPSYTAPLKRGGPFHILHNEQAVVKILVDFLSLEENKSATLKDMQAELKRRGLTEVPSRTTISRYLRENNVTRIKSFQDSGEVPSWQIKRAKGEALGKE